MAEDAGTQNQGQQQQFGDSHPKKNDAFDAKKLDRAAKERERRRRRRRRKAELQRLKANVDTGNISPPKFQADQKVRKARLTPYNNDKNSLNRTQPQSQKVDPKPQSEPGSQPDAPILTESESQSESQVQTEQSSPSVSGLPFESQPQFATGHEPLPQSEPEVQSATQKTPFDSGLTTDPQSEPELQSEPQQTPFDSGLTTDSQSEPEVQSEPQQTPFDGGLTTDSQPEPEVQSEPQPDLQPYVPVQEPASGITDPFPSYLTSADPNAYPPIFPSDEPESSLQPGAQSLTEPELENQLSDQQDDIIIHDNRDDFRPQVEMGPVESVNGTQNDQAEVHDEPQAQEAEPIPEHPQDSSPPEEPEENNSNENQESSHEQVKESEGLGVKKSFAQSAGAFFAGFFKKMGESFHKFRLNFNFRKLGCFVLLALIGGGLYAGYLFKFHEKIYNYFAGFFKAPPPVEVNVDEKLLKEWGITQSYVFGDNRGSVQDILPQQIFNAYYFGFLSEPHVDGETGISGAYFYGKGKDSALQDDQFIAYVDNLRELVSVYDVDIYKTLDQSTNRQKVLDDYLSNLKRYNDKSLLLSNQMKIQIDSLKSSSDTLNTSKSQYEKDFFTSLQGFAGETSSYLLGNFIDAGQKQVAFKARMAALQKVSDYYDAALKKLAIRIAAVEANHQALVEGIRVVDIPGADLDIIIKGTVQ